MLSSPINIIMLEDLVVTPITPLPQKPYSNKLIACWQNYARDLYVLLTASSLDTC